MRDPNRIPQVLEIIGRYWKKHPDLRLSQLISNANFTHRGRKDLPFSDDVFMLEDDDLLAVLEEELS